MRRFAALALFVAAACAHAPGATRERSPSRPFAEGLASWYGPGFAGHRTANGERFEPRAFTAAHRTLPFDTCVRVENVANGRSARVRINDRGPYVSGRIIDLSEAAARELGVHAEGVARVRLYTC